MADFLRRFECRVDGHHKFWVVCVQGRAIHRRWGALGKKGIRKHDEIESDLRAEMLAAAMIREKVEKGYLEVPARSQDLAEVIAPGMMTVPGVMPADAGDRDPNDVAEEQDLASRIQDRVRERWGKS